MKTPATLGLLALLVTASLLFATQPGSEEQTVADPVLMQVGTTTIRDSDVRFLMLSRKIPAAQRNAVESRLIEHLVERELVRLDLAEKRVEPDAEQIDERLRRLEAIIRQGESEPEEVFEKLGFSEERLRAEVQLSLAWEAYLDRVVTEETLREHFEANRAELDGTRVRLRQIFRKAQQDSERGEARKLLHAVKKQIESEELTFAEAAAKYSQSPTGKTGGDLGWVSYLGTVPKELTRAAFGLEVGTISEPLSTSFGVHLLKVTAIEPGDFTLEDVRVIVRKRVSDDLWDAMVETGRREVPITKP